MGMVIVIARLLSSCQEAESEDEDDRRAPRRGVGDRGGGHEHEAPPPRELSINFVVLWVTYDGCYLLPVSSSVYS